MSKFNFCEITKELYWADREGANLKEIKQVLNKHLPPMPEPTKPELVRLAKLLDEQTKLRRARQTTRSARLRANKKLKGYKSHEQVEHLDGTPNFFTTLIVVEHPPVRTRGFRIERHEIEAAYHLACANLARFNVEHSQEITNLANSMGLYVTGRGDHMWAEVHHWSGIALPDVLTMLTDAEMENALTKNKETKL